MCYRYQYILQSSQIFFSSGHANFFEYLFLGMIFFFHQVMLISFNIYFKGIQYAPRYSFLSGHSHFFQYLFQGIQYAPRRNVKLKTELIDVDLVRGIKTKNTGFCQ